MRAKQADLERSEKPNSLKAKFIVELIFAILLSVTCALMGMSNLLWASNDLYPYTADAMGHMTKVVYIAEQLAQGHIPSWFLYWYNGSAVTQYYVPLSYYCMVPVYMITDNVMLTYKIFGGSVMAIGGFGVWLFCYKKIGRVCGLFGIIIFCFQPMLLDSLYELGVVAQGPIIALMPYYLLAVLSCAKSPNRRNFFFSTLLMTLIILSHAILAFMLFLTTLMVLFLLMIIRKIKLRNILIIGLTVAFAACLTAFWSVVGSTELENPGVPYLLPEASVNCTATYHWFIPDDSEALLYFSIITSIFITLSIFVYIIASLRKSQNDNIKFFGFSAIILSITTIIFSFGMYLPGFKFLPMSSSLVAGRILTYTSVSAAITSAYVIKMLWGINKIRALIRPIVFIMIIISIWEMQPLSTTYETSTSNYFSSKLAHFDANKSAFNKGRYQWYGAANTAESFFSFQYDYNISNGWNIKGTVRNKDILSNNIALSTDNYEYTIKQVAYWNIRYLLIFNQFKELADSLLKTKLGFKKVEIRQEGDLYVSDKPSSYYLTDSRNAIVICKDTQSFNIEFPNVVLGKSANLNDYSILELSRYKLVYIIEPYFNSEKEKEEFEVMVTELVNTGITVMIEPANTKNFELFNVLVQDESLVSTPEILTTEKCPYNIEDAELTDNSNLSVLRCLYGLDETYVNIKYQGSNIINTIIGSKNVGNGKVIFIGAHLSQYLKPVYARNIGLEAVNEKVLSNSKTVEAIYNSIFSYYDIEENYLPEAFDTVTKHHWDYQGGTFTYQSEEEKEVIVSVSYSPRWTATLDGKSIEVGVKEDLISLVLPAGEHTVALHYGVTVYGIIGYLISAIALLLFILFIVLWKRIFMVINKINDSLKEYLQIEDYHIKVNFVEENNKEEIEENSKEENNSEKNNEPLYIKIASEETATIENDSESINEIKIRQDQKVHPVQTESPLKEDTVPKGFIQHETIHENGIIVDIIDIDDDIDMDPAEEQPGNINEIREAEEQSVLIVDISENKAEPINTISEQINLQTTAKDGIYIYINKEERNIFQEPVVYPEDTITDNDNTAIKTDNTVIKIDNDNNVIKTDHDNNVIKTDYDNTSIKTDHDNTFITTANMEEDIEIISDIIEGIGVKAETNSDSSESLIHLLDYIETSLACGKPILDNNESVTEIDNDIGNIIPINREREYNKGYDEYDEILKLAIYESERNRLKDYYEYLRANVAENKKDQATQNRRNTKQVYKASSDTSKKDNSLSNKLLSESVVKKYKQKHKELMRKHKNRNCQKQYINIKYKDA